ncbi:MAG: FkbM family methyltransferase [Vicinamibacterales bacterium]
MAATRSRHEAAIVLVLVGVLTLTGYQLGRTLGERSGALATWQRLELFLQEKRTAEIQALAKAYGPSRYSEHVEEWIVKDFFKDERDGVFVEVGANHHQRFSNTYYLETVMGWSGVAVEPQVKFAAGYRQHRPRTTFVPLFISDVSNRQATLYVTENDLVASGAREFTASFGEVTATTATTSTLDDVLDRLGIQRLDFLSIDIELAEPQALAGFSIARFAPRLVAIEAHPPVRQQILDYFARRQYVLLGRYWQADDDNFWFAPLGRTGSGTPLSEERHPAVAHH